MKLFRRVVKVRFLNKRNFQQKISIAYNQFFITFSTILTLLNFFIKIISPFWFRLFFKNLFKIFMQNVTNLDSSMTEMRLFYLKAI